MADHITKDRNATKRAFIEQIGKTRQLIMEEESAEAVKEAVEELKVRFKMLTEAHDAVLKTMNEEKDLDDAHEYYEEMRERYLEALSKAKNYRREKNNSKKSSLSSSDSTERSFISREEFQLMINLPKLTLEPFDGNPLQYHEFMATFDETVDRAPGSDMAKLLRLLNYTRGVAKEAIRKCVLLGGKEGYGKARDILENRFGNEYVITEAIVGEIRRGKQIRTAPELQQFADELDHGLTILEKMGRLHELDTQCAIVEVLGRLQPCVQDRWMKKALEDKRRNGSYPDFPAFVGFVSVVAQEDNDPVYGRHDSKDAEPRIYKCAQTFLTQSTSDNQQAFQVTDKEHWRTEPPCVMCGDRHRLWHCSQFKQKSPRDRLKIVSNNKLCHNCLRGNHSTGNCQKNSVCSVAGCGEKHSKFVHQPETNRNEDKSAKIMTKGNNRLATKTRHDLDGKEGCRTTALRVRQYRESRQESQEDTVEGVNSGRT